MARARSEESTILDANDASAAGKYLCCDCGVAFSKANYARQHEWSEHLPREAKNRPGVTKVRDVPAEYLEPRWIVLYSAVGRQWEHPKEVEAKKERICRILDREGAMKLRDLLEAVQPSSDGVAKPHEAERWMNRDELETLLTELEDDDQVVRSGGKWRTV